MKPLSPELGRVYEGLRKSSSLEKLGEAGVDTAKEKAENDRATFEKVKQAAFGMEMAKGLMHSPFAKGLGYAAGAAVPAVMAGNMISNHAAEQARNKALEAGLGIAGIGASMYGLHHLMSGQKTASDVNTALEKLATIGYIDSIMSDIDSPLANEIKYLNAEYACDILRSLID